MILTSTFSPDSTELFVSIATTSRQTAENTALGPYDFSTIMLSLLAFFVSVASLYVAKRTLDSQEQTEANTKRVSKQSLIKMVEHLFELAYVDYIRSCGILHKFSLSSFSFNSYPSLDQVSYMAFPLEYVLLDHCGEITEDNQIALIKLKRAMTSYNDRLEYRFDCFRDSSIPVDVKKREVQRLQFESAWMMVLIDRTLKQMRGVEDLENPSSDIVTIVNRKNDDIKADAPSAAYSTASIAPMLDIVRHLFSPDVWNGSVEEAMKLSVCIMVGLNKRGEEYVPMITF